MIRFSEAVLAGHPDKFCDQIADAIVVECYRADPEAYCQVEVACWGDEIWLTGGIVTREPLANPDLGEIARETGRRIGYVKGNAIVADRYRVRDSVCVQVGDPRRWTRHVNDQCISLGWAGYDERVRYLPPEHFLAHSFREALTASFDGGRLKGQGPDGKLLVRLRENHDHWVLEHVLVTIQHLEDVSVIDLAGAVDAELSRCYDSLRAADGRWAAAWGDVDLSINPNGPLLNGGSDGDNGQTGRKLVVDYYGPRIPIGGGALCGKDLAHIDRASAYAARRAAVQAVADGAGECLVTVAWAPNVGEPLDVAWAMERRVGVPDRSAFRHGVIRSAFGAADLSVEIARGGHFFEPEAGWNRGGGGSGVQGEVDR